MPKLSASRAGVRREIFTKLFGLKRSNSGRAILGVQKIEHNDFWTSLRL